MEQRIRDIVFDIGGVLADFRIKEFLSEKGFDGTMIRRILNASVMSPYWGQFERGELTEEEALRGFASTDPEIERELNLAYANIEGMLTSRDYAIPLIQGLHGAGYKVFYLSNYSKKAYDECGESLAFMPYMDGGVVSFQVGLTKPDSRVYQLFLERYGLAADECLFIDDTAENVSAAQALGFSALEFKNYEELPAALARHGVELQIQEG